jgi:hypothetical protein
MNEHAESLFETGVDRLLGVVGHTLDGPRLATKIDDGSDASLFRQEPDLRVAELPIAASDDFVGLKLAHKAREEAHVSLARGLAQLRSTHVGNLFVDGRLQLLEDWPT